MKSAINNKNNRIIYFDYLRILATISVIVIHVVAQNYYFTDINTYQWNILSIYHSITPWCVPIFVMISGTLFLNKNHDIKTIYSKYIPRIITSFVFWTFFYAITDVFLYGCKTLCYITRFFEGHYHLWFLFMIAGLYMIIPFLKKITESTKLTKYFLILSIIFTFIIPQTISIVSLISKDIASILNNMINHFSLNLVLGYSGYFICGYYLNKINMTKKWKKIIYITGIISFIITIIMTITISKYQQEASTILYDYLTINVMFQSLFIFTLAKNHLNNTIKNKKLENIIIKLSKYSFGIYLVHPFIIEILDTFLNLDSLTFNPIVSIPIITIIVFLLSLIISIILNKIPIIKKYIV